MMIPKKNRHYFKMTCQKRDGDNSLIEGILTCCNAHNFDVFVAGEIQHSVLSKMYLLSENDNIVLKVRCQKCGKVICIFDSSCDGYEQCGSGQHTYTALKQIRCKKCLDDSFSVVIRYEYSNIEELEKFEIIEIDNAFTWIWITLECNKCGTRYKNFIDYETT